MSRVLQPISRPLLTGASGFVGAALSSRLGVPAALSMRRSDWREGIDSCDFRGATVLHLAARVHEPGATAADFEADNVVKTRILAEAAAAGGATRFVFASTVKVFGEESGERAFNESDKANPSDAYARSKWRAEEELRAISARTGLPVVIVRIPLTYGRGAAGNFRALVRLADSGWWLPFAGIANRRSLVHLDDLVEAMVIAASHPEAPGHTLLVAHPRPVSTPRLVEAIRSVLGRPGRLFTVPPALLEAGAAVAGQRARMQRLTRSLDVDPSTLTQEFGWIARMDLDAGLAATLRGIRQ